MSSGVGLVPRVGLAMFAMTVGCKMYDYVLRNAIHDPAFQVLYHPLPLVKRFAVLTRAEPGAALIGGGLLLIGRLYFEIDAANVALIVIVILGVQMVFTFSLGERYLGQLMEALKKRRMEFSERQVWDEGGQHLLLGFLKSNHPHEVIYALSLMEKNAPHTLSEHLPDLLLHSSPEVLTEVLARIEQLRPPMALPLVRQESSLATWLLSCLRALPPCQDFGLLSRALEEESHRCRNRILSMASLFGPIRIRGGLHRGITGDDRVRHAYTLEMLDSFLSGDLKELIFPLLEDLPQNERSRNETFVTASRYEGEWK